MKKWLWLTVVSLVLLGFLSVMEMGSGHLGKTYVETEEFINDYNSFTDHLIAIELDPISDEKEWPISNEEIEEYRNRYGTLSEQLRNIQDQYIDDIEQAQSSENKSLEKIFMEERDRKLAAITENFADDDVVREKIKEERSKGIEQAINQLNNLKPSFAEETTNYSYKLKNIETGEIFTKGTIKESAYFEKTYTAGNPLSASYISYYDLDVPVPEDALFSNARFEGTIQMDKALLAASTHADNKEQFDLAKTILYIFVSMMVAGIILLLTTLKYEKKWFANSYLYHKWNKLMMEVRLLLIFSTMIFGLGGSADFFSIIQYSWSLNNIEHNLIWMFIHFSTAFFFIGLTVLQLMWFMSYYNNKRLLKLELHQSIGFRCFSAVQQAFLNKSIGFQTLVLLIVIFFWGFGTALLFFVGGTILVWIPATLLIGLPVLFFMLNRFGYLNILMQGTENMADGRLNEELPVRGKSALAHHARQLNLLKEGVRQSMSEQAKSERLKTELITNVSHDLRTPLTSIITYTDLMKAPDLSDEERMSYVAILDRKSQRLKTLIEDLFEVSKMASGNMDIQRTRLDLTQLMTQAFAEHAEDIAESGLDFRISAPENAIYINADGQKWWRVLDNLIINAIKYALSGTRVYVSLNEADGHTEFIIKNVTRYELGENTDELFERFKRGDVSRQTEGSGLGLAIAQSIVELHGGSLRIEVDGDLFKVTVTIHSI